MRYRCRGDRAEAVATSTHDAMRAHAHATSSRASFFPLASSRSGARGSRRIHRAPDVRTRAVAVRTDEDSSFLEQFELEVGACVAQRAYTPGRIQKEALATPGDRIRVIGRVLEVTGKLGGFALSLAWDGIVEEDLPTPQRVKSRAAQLREMLVSLGPSFIKAGQVLANRPDIIREDYMNELCILQDDVPAFSNAQAFEILENELGTSLDDVFSEISDAPIAAASLGQVYKARLRSNGELVAVKVQRPGIRPIIARDLFLFRKLAYLINPFALERLGCNAQLILDEFGQKIMEELDYVQETRNLKDFYENFKNDPYVKIPKVFSSLCTSKVIVMEWIDGIRCTDPQGIRDAGIDVEEFIRVGVVSGLRQLLEFGLFHGDPHPGNIFALRDGRIAYVDFGNVAELSSRNKQILIDAVVHAINEDYEEMAGDFMRLGFLAPGTDVSPIVPALEKIWQDSLGQSLEVFNFRAVTARFNRLVYRYPIRIPERYSLVIRSLLTQEGICMTLTPDFKFLEVAYPYVAKRLLTDEDPALRERLFQVLFRDGKFQWERLENLICLARDGGGDLDLNDTLKDIAKVVLLDSKLRKELLIAFTDDNRLHLQEVRSLMGLVHGRIDTQKLVQESAEALPTISRLLLKSWSESVLAL